MDKKTTETLPLRLLLNAEPFGFGPTAAIASFFPYLQGHFAKIGYMGKMHTLDLQKDLPYDAIHDVTDVPKDERTEDYAPIFAQYDILFTAMDHKVAEEAQKAGLKVYYYDALAWYWPEIPKAVQECDLYIVQNFFGVEERVKSTFDRHAIVPPLAKQREEKGDKHHVLINLGGLQNPYWPIDSVTEYARAVIRALRKAIPPSEKIVIAGSQIIAARLRSEGVVTYPRQEIEKILAHSKCAFMTPGLGNIYDAAIYNLPTVWLPPANDSQGQQLVEIERHGMSDATLDWHNLGFGTPIDYKDNQSTVLSSIAAATDMLAGSVEAQENLSRLAQIHYACVSQKTSSDTAKIVDRFGGGGECEVARLVIEEARRYCYG